MPEWFYQRGEAQFGPLNTDQLKVVWKRGHLSDDTLVRRQGAERWEPLAQADLTISPSESGSPQAKSWETEWTPISEDFTNPPTSLWATAITVLTVIVFVCLADSFCAAIKLHTLILAGGLLDWEKEANETLAAAAPWIYFIFFSTLIAWQAAAFASLNCIYERGFVKHSQWSGFWWITPFANLFMPFICLYEMQDISRYFSTRRRIGSPSGALLWSIEITLILSILIKLVALIIKDFSAEITPLASSADSQRTLLIISALDDISTAAFVAAIGYFILTNLRQQIRLYRERYR